MRVFFDTNVLIAAILSNGLCHDLPRVLSCQPRDLREKLTDKFKVSSDHADRSIALLREQAEVIGDVRLEKPVSRDPDDDNVLAAARAGRCEAIVTGDKDLLVLGEFAGIPILTPRQLFDSEGPVV